MGMLAIITDLGKTCCEHDDFVELAHFLQEAIDAGSLQHVEVVPIRLDLDRNDVIWRRYCLS